MERPELTAAPGDSGRLDAWLAGQCPTLSASALQNLIEQGLVTCGGAPVNKRIRWRPAKSTPSTCLTRSPSRPGPKNIPLDIGVRGRRPARSSTSLRAWSCTPAPGNPDGTLVNALLYHCAGQLSGIGGEPSARASSTALTRTRAAFSSLPKRCRPSGAQRPDERTQHPPRLPCRGIR